MPELYQIVDEDDEVIGHKLRHDIDFQKDIYHIAALWLINDKDEVLIAQRLLSKDKDPGKWGPAAAGTLEQGEDYLANIYKEAKEEIGLFGVDFVLGPKQRFHVRESFCQWFIGKCNWTTEQFTPQPDEVEQVKWISRDKLRQDVEAHPDKYVPSMLEILEVV